MMYIPNTDTIPIVLVKNEKGDAYVNICDSLNYYFNSIKNILKILSYNHFKNNEF